MERGGAESTGPTTASRKARGQGIPTRTGKLRRPGVLPPDPPSTQLLEGAVTQREAAHPCETGERKGPHERLLLPLFLLEPKLPPCTRLTTQVMHVLLVKVKDFRISSESSRTIANI